MGPNTDTHKVFGRLGISYTLQVVNQMIYVLRNNLGSVTYKVYSKVVEGFIPDPETT